MAHLRGVLSSDPKSSHRLYARSAYVAAAVATIVLGLAVHLRGAALGPVARDVIGDALWATMIAWWVAAIVPARSLLVRSATSIAICFAVELSQLYHAPPLDALRRTTIGRLTLGSGFDTRDLVAYVGGVLAALLLERVVRRWFVHRSQGEEG